MFEQVHIKLQLLVVVTDVAQALIDILLSTLRYQLQMHELIKILHVQHDEPLYSYEEQHNHDIHIHGLDQIPHLIQLRPNQL